MNNSIIKKIFKFRFLILILSGLVTALPFIIPKLGFLQWVSMIPAIIILYISADIEKTKCGKLYLYGVLYFWSFYAVVFHWFLYMYPMEFAGLSKGAALFVVIFAMFGLSLLQALMSGIIFYVFAKIIRCTLVMSHKTLMPIIFACLYVVAEWWQTVGWWGVPWGRLPIGQEECIYNLQSASIFGSYFVTLLLVGVNAYLAYAFLYARYEKMITLCCIGAISVNALFGACYIKVCDSKNEDKKSLTVAAIQGNISADDKWDSGDKQYYDTIRVYEKYTREAAEKGAELVLWPETALPYNFFNNRYGMVDKISSIAKECNITLVISAFTEKKGIDGVYNSVFVIGPDGEYLDGVYSKQHLVPFGEYVPMEELIMTLIPPLSELEMLDRDIIPGTSSEPLITDKGKISIGICFDSIYERVFIESSRLGGELICVATNDSWFRDSRALYMHNAQSRLRAIENGKCVLRAANTGVSSVISQNGEVLDLLSEEVEGYVIGNVYLNDNRTLYTYIGNSLVYVSIAFLALVPIISNIKNKIKSKNEIS